MNPVGAQGGGGGSGDPRRPESVTSSYLETRGAGGGGVFTNGLGARAGDLVYQDRAPYIFHMYGAENVLTRGILQNRYKTK